MIASNARSRAPNVRLYDLALLALQPTAFNLLFVHDHLQSTTYEQGSPIVIVLQQAVFKS